MAAPLESQSSPRRPGSWPLGTALSLASVLLVFAGVVAWHIELPGLYMDAVNPDYLVVDLINGPSDSSPIWILPGNLLKLRVPLLTSLYHGTLNMWLALPFVALFGPKLAALRAAQALAGAAILIMMFFLVRDGRAARSPWLAWLPAIALAIDPVFVYSFRTQLYIQLCPVALLFAALLAGRHALPARTSDDARPPALRPAWLVIAGLCYGLSIFGYFIFIFFAPALLVAITLASRHTGPTPRFKTSLKAVAWAGAGFALGVSGYVVGYVQVFRTEGGLDGFLAFFSQYQQSLGAFEQHRALSEIPGYFANLIWRVFSNDWQHALMFGDPQPEPASVLKLSLLLALPVLVWAWGEIRGIRSWRLQLALGLIGCYPAVALVFGDRLSGHHFVVLLPLAYFALGVGLAELAAGQRRVAVHTAVVTTWLAMVVLNLIGLHATGTELLQTHGRGLFSDAIDRFAADAIAQESAENRQHFYFPDWGLFMPFHFLTNGRIRHSIDLDIDIMRNELCHGQNISVAFVTGDTAARFETLTSQLGWTRPDLVPYLSHEGLKVFTIGKYAGLPSGSARDIPCAAPGNG